MLETPSSNGKSIYNAIVVPDGARDARDWISVVLEMRPLPPNAEKHERLDIEYLAVSQPADPNRGWTVSWRQPQQVGCKGRGEAMFDVDWFV